MEAFQLTLGRTADVVLPLSFRSPVVANGQTVFMSPAARCNGCHNNASAHNAAGINRNFNTGVEDQVDRPIKLLVDASGLDLTPGNPANKFPRDGGFGVAVNPAGGFGDGTFNTPPLIEAADTGPFFHDNQIRTIEGAVAFYNGTAFAASPSGAGGAIDLQPTQVEGVAAFLRVLNALENVRASRDLLVTTRDLTQARRDRAGPHLVGQARKEMRDAVQVLTGADLHPEAAEFLRSALQIIPDRPLMDGELTPALMTAMIGMLDLAKANMVN